MSIARGRLKRNKATNFFPEGIPPAIFDLQHTFVFDRSQVPIDGLEALHKEGVVINDVSIAQTRKERRPSETEEKGDNHDIVYRTLSSIAIDNPDCVYAKLLQLMPCYQAMPSNNKVVVFTEDNSVRKSFYGLIYNSTRTGLIADSKSLEIVGVLSITDFIMAIMLMWKYREGHEPGTISQEDLSGMDISSMEISRWKDMLNLSGQKRKFIYSSVNSSLFHAAEMLREHRIHRLPIMDDRNDCAFIITHRRILHFIWTFLASVPKPDYLTKSIKRLGVGRYERIHYATEDTPLIKVLDMLVDNGISGIPIVESNSMKVVGVYSRFDAISIAFAPDIDLNISVRQAMLDKVSTMDVSFKKSCEDLMKQQDAVVQVREDATFMELLTLFVETNVHRIFVTSEGSILKGLVSLSDVIDYMVLRPARDMQQNNKLNNAVNTHLAKILENL